MKLAFPKKIKLLTRQEHSLQTFLQYSRALFTSNAQLRMLVLSSLNVNKFNLFSRIGSTISLIFLRDDDGSIVAFSGCERILGPFRPCYPAIKSKRAQLSGNIASFVS